jgi:pimeloyl-ACP methyl ester carboxylesterase
MADDIAALIDHLGLDKPDLVGYSLGGWVALHTAAKYPAKVGRLVAASANIRPDAIYPEMRVQQGQVNAAAAEFMTDTPMYQFYHRVAPRPEAFPRPGYNRRLWIIDVRHAAGQSGMVRRPEERIGPAAPLPTRQGPR